MIRDLFKRIKVLNLRQTVKFSDPPLNQLHIYLDYFLSYFYVFGTYPNQINELVLCTAAAPAHMSRLLHPLQLLITQSFEKVESSF